MPQMQAPSATHLLMFTPDPRTAAPPPCHAMAGGQVIDNEDGTYTATYATLVSGLYDLHVLLQGRAGSGAASQPAARKGRGRARWGAQTRTPQLVLPVALPCTPWSDKAILLPHMRTRPCPVGTTAGADGEASSHVGESPYILRVAGGKPCTRRTTVAGAGRSTAAAGQPASFLIEVRAGGPPGGHPASPAAPLACAGLAWPSALDLLCTACTVLRAVSYR